MDLDALLVALTVEEGAAKVQVITQEKIVLSDEFYDICKSNACGQFGVATCARRMWEISKP
ncbi:MAG: hypothetical protein ACOX55_01365 [Christensenellales bacterium]